jgi:hypothetical protein
MALLARTYLYTQDWLDAETQTDSVISNSSLYGLDTLNGVFLKNSNEAIWQLQPVNNGWNTADAEVFVIPPTGPDPYNYPVYLSPFILNSFETGDLRRLNWVDSVIVGNTAYYYPYKYKSATFDNPVTEYLMVLRLGELYLIRAESEIELNDLPDATNDLNIIRNRAGLPNTSATTKIELLAAIQHERQVELFTEWGHRWMDLKRTGEVDTLMSTVCPIKGGSWQSYQQLYPLPLSDIQEDHNLTQNQGY